MNEKIIIEFVNKKLKEYSRFLEFASEEELKHIKWIGVSAVGTRHKFGVNGGGFATAIANGDLLSASMRGDEINRKALTFYGMLMRDSDYLASYYNAKQQEYFLATIKWLDNGNIQDDMLFKIGDIDENDDNVFFYLQDEKEIEDFKKEGVNDFVIIDIVKNTKEEKVRDLEWIDGDMENEIYLDTNNGKKYQVSISIERDWEGMIEIK